MTVQQPQLPLAVRMRPKSLDEFIGQSHVTAPNSPIPRLVNGAYTGITSILIYGPPGTGKTTLANLIASSPFYHFVTLSATSAGVADVRKVLADAEQLRKTGKSTVLFIDEVHRFSKAQQDTLLPAVEQRLVTLVAATTENPAFSIISPLLSRTILITLKTLDDDQIKTIITRALAHPDGLPGVTIEPDALDALVQMSAGDARRALTYLEAASAVDANVTLAAITTAVDKVVAIYDRAGDNHYDIASAFIKSIRGSDADAALHYLARMIRSGEDPRFIARRLMISAAEDIGLADPQALVLATSAATSVALIGFPEARITLSMVTLYLAMAPKSNSAYLAIDAALKELDTTTPNPPPAHLRDAHSGSLKDTQQAVARKQTPYIYPHDLPSGIATQQYLPKNLSSKRYYFPTTHGVEAKISVAFAHIMKILKGE